MIFSDYLPTKTLCTVSADGLALLSAVIGQQLVAAASVHCDDEPPFFDCALNLEFGEHIELGITINHIGIEVLPGPVFVQPQMDGIRWISEPVNSLLTDMIGARVDDVELVLEPGHFPKGDIRATTALVFRFPVGQLLFENYESNQGLQRENVSLVRSMIPYDVLSLKAAMGRR